MAFKPVKMFYFNVHYEHPHANFDYVYLIMLYNYYDVLMWTLTICRILINVWCETFNGVYTMVKSDVVSDEENGWFYLECSFYKKCSSHYGVGKCSKCKSVIWCDQYFKHTV